MGRYTAIDDIIAVLKNYCIEHPEHPVAIWLNANVKARTAVLRENIQYSMCSVLAVMDKQEVERELVKQELAAKEAEVPAK